MMKKYIIFIFLLLNSLSSFSVGNSLVGPTTVDPGTYYSYRANLDVGYQYGSSVENYQWSF